MNRLLKLCCFLTILLTINLLAPLAKADDHPATNLLFNPSFEGEYTGYDPNTQHAMYNDQVASCTPPYGGPAHCGTAQMPANWWPWWVNQTGSDEAWKNRMPEYKPAEAPYLTRIRSGSRASQYFTFHSTHTAGLLQVVPVPENAILRFSIWGFAWSSFNDDTWSNYPTTVNMKVGIDPTGGTNPFSSNIVWSGYNNVYDSYQEFAVEAQAQGGTVSVFTYSAPDEARKHNDVYWDDASLVVVGAGVPGSTTSTTTTNSDGSTTTTVSNQPSVAYIPTGPTATPNAEGVIYSTVQNGDTMWGVAARAGITLDQLLTYNNLGRSDFVRAGQLLIIGYGDSTQPTINNNTDSTASNTDSAATEPTPLPPTAVPTVPPTPEPVAALTTGSICLKAFDDSNQNGSQDTGEELRESVAFTLVKEQKIVSNYVTNGETEPFCINGLTAGEYKISRSKRTNEELTTQGEWTLSLTAGSEMELAFGSYLQTDQAPTNNNTTNLTNNNNSLVDDESNSSIPIIAGLLITLLLIGLMALIVSSRRTTL